MFQAGVVFGPEPENGEAHFWPFMNYPMYSAAHQEGDQLDRFFLFATVTDYGDITIKPSDFGLNYYTFMRDAIPVFRDDNRDKIHFFMKLYESRQGRKLISVRLENHSWVITRSGAVPNTPKVVRELKFTHSLEETQ